MSAPAAQAPRYRTRTTCRGCGESALETVLEYGPMPLAGAFPKPEDADAQELYPLTLTACSACGLAQVAEMVDPDVLFRDYRYRASVPLARHFAAYADTVPERIGLEPSDLIVEAGCNDGVLLAPLRERGFANLLGIDPADNVTRHVPDGIPVLSDYFEPAVAERVLAERGPAGLVAANNVFAHMDDPNAFVQAAATLLAPDGVYAFEVHYLLDLLDAYQYDTVYHEHVMYYSLTALRPLLARHGLRIFDVERIANHGGSVRVFSCLEHAPRPSSAELDSLLAEEDRRGLGRMDAFRDFAAGVRARVDGLDRLVEEHASAGERVAAFGAAGRASILFNMVPALARHVGYVADESPERIGRLIPGTRVPITAPERFEQEPADLVLLSAWSYADVLAEKVSQRMGPERTPRFCVPLPEPRLL